MFKVGDTVVYGTSGVCRVEDIRREKFAGKDALYYILNAENAQTIYIPVDNEVLTAKMRRIMTRDEALEFVRSLPDIEPVHWIEESRKRNELFKAAIVDADRTRLAAVIKAIYNKRKSSMENGKKLYLADENAFKKAERMLHGELATVLGIKYEEVAGFIEKELDA